MSKGEKETNDLTAAFRNGFSENRDSAGEIELTQTRVKSIKLSFRAL
jgi:hypothetical protein